MTFSWSSRKQTQVIYDSKLRLQVTVLATSKLRVWETRQGFAKRGVTLQSPCGEAWLCLVESGVLAALLYLFSRFSMYLFKSFDLFLNCLYISLYCVSVARGFRELDHLHEFQCLSVAECLFFNWWTYWRMLWSKKSSNDNGLFLTLNWTAMADCSNLIVIEPDVSSSTTWIIWPEQ